MAVCYTFRILIINEYYNYVSVVMSVINKIENSVELS